MVRMLVTMFAFLFATPIASQAIDETDLSNYAVVPVAEAPFTLSDLDKMSSEYRGAVKSGDCESALPLIVDFADAANRVSNLVRQGNKPFYDANADGRDAVAVNKVLLDDLIAAENLFNELLKRRNTAWVEEAKCLLKLGRNNEATNRLYRALDYITVDEGPLWAQARLLLWKQVGYQP